LYFDWHHQVGFFLEYCRAQRQGKCFSGLSSVVLTVETGRINDMFISIIEVCLFCERIDQPVYREFRRQVFDLFELPAVFFLPRDYGILQYQEIVVSVIKKRPAYKST